jgi:ABC-2 type transport system ATP-binding protein
MIKIKQLNYYYKGRPALFDHLNLELTEGHIYGLLGKNGAGKSTLLKLMLGSIFPKQGHCEVNRHISSYREPTLLNDIYFLPVDIFVPQLSVSQYLDLHYSFYPHFNCEQFYDALAEFELPKNEILTRLSHGQKQKFMIAFALATNVSILILDEPTNGLDIPSKKQFRKLIAEYATDNKILIISTHQVHDVEQLVDVIVILDEGQILLNESVENISQLLQVTTQNTLPDMTNTLYYEQSLSGYRVIHPALNDKETVIDFEFLFNAVLSSPNQFKQIFSRKSYE